MRTIKELSIKAKRVPIAAEDKPLYDAKVCSPDVAVMLARTALRVEENDTESFVVIPLDIKNKPLGFQTVSNGAPDVCVVDPRFVFRAAILMGASSVIVAHNHPSGDPTPSDEDIKLTERLVEAGKLLGIPVLDHIILGEDCYVSLAEKGVI